MKDVVIFDCNGIFLHFEEKFTTQFCKDFNIPLEIFIPVHMEIMNNVRRPNAPSLFELWEPYFAQWGIEIDQQGLYDYWFLREKEVPQMQELVKELTANSIETVILSNNFKERHDYKLSFFEKLDNLCTHTYYSWQTGFVKPHHDAFKYVLNKNNYTPEECLFFDDSPINVAAAEELGIVGTVFESPKQCRAILKEQGIL